MPKETLRNNEFVFPWQRSRPRIIIFLSIFLILFSFLYVIKVSQILIQWDILVDLQLAVSPLFLLMDGIVWAISAGFLSCSLWLGKPWIRIVGMIISLTYVFRFWLEAIFFAEPSGLNHRWPFNLVLTLIGLSIFWLTLNHPRCQAFFNRNLVNELDGVQL
jgi:hypothetical protein